MKTKHIFVSALDVGELLPFIIKKSGKLKKSLEDQEKARQELEKFIDILERNYRKNIYYMGMDIIAGKNYERCIFEDSGFFEVMTDAPIAMSAHFVHEKKAQKFAEALQKTLLEIMPPGPVTDMFINSIQVQKEESEQLTYKKWSDIKKIRNL